MKRQLVLVALLSVLLSGVLIAITTGSHSSQGLVYTVAQVQAGLADQPQAWRGRTVQVRGRAIACRMASTQGHLYCAPAAPHLADPGAGTTSLTLVPQGPLPVVAFLRRLSPLDNLLPAPQVLHWWAVATYRVRLQAIPESLYSTGVCFEALLLDAAP